MSKGEIVSSEGEGLYTIRLKYARERVDEELQRINQKIADLAVQVPEKKLAVIQAEAEADDIERQIDLVIADFRQDPDAHRDALVQLQTGLAKFQLELAQLRWARDNAIMQDLALKKRRGQLNSIPEDKVLQAWCADFTEDLSGEIGLIDLNDEGSRGVIIQPGFEDNAVYQGDRDGQLVHRRAQSAAQVYFNAAILPGVQKWMPRYRVGTISNIENDQCNVTLDPAQSSAQGLDINHGQTYSGVPIVYMDCHGAAFEDGDRVVVRFTGAGPLVVGFEREPRRCDLPVWLIGNRNIVYEMEPDFSAVKRSVATGDYSIRVAVYNDQVAVVRSTEPNGGDFTLQFLGGPSYKESGTIWFNGLCSSPTGFWAQRVDIDPGGAVHALKFGPDGLLTRQLTLQGLNGELLASGGGSSFTCDDETISTNSYNGTNYSSVLASALDGALLGTGPISAHQPSAARNDRHTFVLTGHHVTWSCSIFENGTYNQVGGFTLPPGQYRCVVASKTKLYAFSVDSGVQPWECIAQIYRLDGTSVSYEGAVDMGGSFGIHEIYSCDVDGALLFS